MSGHPSAKLTLVMAHAKSFFNKLPNHFLDSFSCVLNFFSLFSPPHSKKQKKKMDSLSYSSVKSMLIQARGSLNSRLSEFEPLALLVTPLVTLFLAQVIGSVLGVVHEKGLKACLLGFIMCFFK